MIRALILALTILVGGSQVAKAVANFPAALDDNTSLTLLANGDVYVASLHNNLKDAIFGLEAKVGTDGSAVTSSLDYLVKNPASIDPGHTHTTSAVAIADGSAAAPGLRFGSPVTDTNTGLFHPGVGLIAFSSAGVEKVRINGTGVSILDAGGADFPLDVAGIVRIQGANSLCFGGTGAADNDTCMARSGAAALTLAGGLTVTSLVSPTINAGTAVTTIGNSTGGITLPDGVNIAVNTTTGTKIGTATSQKLGFFNATPVVQPLASAGLLTGLQALGLIASGTFSGDITTTGNVSSAGVTATTNVTTGGLIGTTQAATMVNGANTNFAVAAAVRNLRITGPTGAFSINSFAVSGGNVDGKELHVYSTVNQTLTITNQATGTAANQIITQHGADIVCTATEPASFTVVYDGTSSRWRVLSTTNCIDPT